MSSPPPSPLRMSLTVSTVANAIIKFKRRHDALDFTSGTPTTHPSLADPDATCARRVPLGHVDRYLCQDAVDAVKLLRSSRASVLAKAVLLGGNVLVEESWECQIRIPRNRQDGKFRVMIRYCASASRSSLPDPQKPVALDKVMNVPGLMTIIDRQEVAP